MTDTFRYRLTVEDYAALVNAIGLRRRFGQPPRWAWYAIGAINLGLAATSVAFVTDSSWNVLFFGAVALFAFAAPSLYWMMLRRTFRRQGLGDGDVTLSFGDKSLHVEQRGITSDIDYSVIGKVDDRRGHILLWLNDVQALILPKRELAGMSADRILEMIGRHRT